MDTNDFAAKLADDLRPVRRALPAMVTCGIWIAVTGVLVGLFVAAGGVRPDYEAVLGRLDFLLPTIGMVIAGALSGFVAFHLRAPMARIPAFLKGTLGLATLFWVFEILRAYGASTGIEDHAHLHHDFLVHHCVVNLALMILAPGIFLFVLLRRGATTHAFWAGYAAVLAVSSFGAIGMRYLCPVDDPAHLLVWHFMPVALYAAIGAGIAKYPLRW